MYYSSHTLHRNQEAWLGCTVLPAPLTLPGKILFSIPCWGVTCFHHHLRRTVVQVAILVSACRSTSISLSVCPPSFFASLLSQNVCIWIERNFSLANWLKLWKERSSVSPTNEPMKLCRFYGDHRRWLVQLMIGFASREGSFNEKNGKTLMRQQQQQQRKVD